MLYEMNEIGSEFWLGCTPSSSKEYSMRPYNIYHSDLFNVVETLSGRTALEYIVEFLKAQGKRIAYLPSYCCHTMIEPFLLYLSGRDNIADILVSSIADNPIVGFGMR